MMGTDRKRSEWLKEISAYLSDGYEVTEYGKSRIKIVSFANSDYPLALLSHIWNEYDTYAGATLDWLYELGTSSSLEVRLRAAAVAGQLAAYEFRPVREKIISPWAKSNKRNLQRLSALALTVVAYEDEEEVARQALNLLHHWSGLKNALQLHWTCISAYGSYIGLLFPEDALSNLKIIATHGDGRLFSGIAQAVVDLFEAGTKISGLHASVLKDLKEWVIHDKSTSAHRLGLLIFWGLMHESWIVQNDIKQPTLLSLSKKSQSFEDTIVYLLRKSLDLDLTRDLVLPEIHSWLVFVDQHQSLYKSLARIIFASARPGKERERICSFLRRWSRDSQSAAQIYKLIERHS
jgi:hypothetical protein